MSTSITKDIVLCQQLLKDKKLVAIPTETVYGLAANAFDENAVQQIFEMKGRPRFNPLIIHIHKLEQLNELAKNIPPSALKLAEFFWPGSLTLILPKKDKVPSSVTAGKSTVGIRMPNHPMTLKLLEGLPFPLAAPSANPFTRVSPTSAEHVARYFDGRISAILDGGPCEVGLESTIVGFEGDIPIVYRKGGISIEAIEAVVGNVKLLIENETSPQAPGMLLKHYSPKTPLILSNDLNDTIKKYGTKKMGILSFYKNDFPSAEIVKTLSPKKNMETAAKNLFAALHDLDEANLDIIIAERFPDEGLGSSINDRLLRAQN